MSRRHSAKDVLRFFELIDLHVARHLDVHVVLDNLSAHKIPEVTKWRAHPKRARWHLHFIPTRSSWLNSASGVQRGHAPTPSTRHLHSVPALVEAIEVWVEHWNDEPKPFVWHKTAEEIIANVRRGRTSLAQLKSATQP